MCNVKVNCQLVPLPMPTACMLTSRVNACGRHANRDACWASYLVVRLAACSIIATVWQLCTQLSHSWIPPDWNVLVSSATWVPNFTWSARRRSWSHGNVTSVRRKRRRWMKFVDSNGQGTLWTAQVSAATATLEAMLPRFHSMTELHMITCDVLNWSSLRTEVCH